MLGGIKKSRFILFSTVLEKRIEVLFNLDRTLKYLRIRDMYKQEQQLNEKYCRISGSRNVHTASLERLRREYFVVNYDIWGRFRKLHSKNRGINNTFLTWRLDVPFSHRRQRSVNTSPWKNGKSVLNVSITIQSYFKILFFCELFSVEISELFAEWLKNSALGTF